MKWFTPNLSPKGRVLRGLAGLALIAGAVLAWSTLKPLAVLLLVSALFVLFEAVRGWCVLRACGLKTKF